CPRRGVIRLRRRNAQRCLRGAGQVRLRGLGRGPMTNLRPANRGSPSVTRRYATTATRVFVAVTALTAPGGFTAMAAGPWPSMGRPPPRVGGGSGDAALVVAIEDCAVLPDIPGAEDNGRAWRSWFVETRALKPSRVQVLLGSEGTPAQIAAQAKRLAAS